MSSHAWLIVLALAACGGPSPVYPAGSPPDIVQACSLTQRKCTACHERERWMDQRHTPEEWRDVVEEMRLLAGSGITPRDAEEVVRCLNYRSATPAASVSRRFTPAVADVGEQAPTYVAPRGEVQALHFALHNPLHFVDTSVPQRSVSAR